MCMKWKEALVEQQNMPNTESARQLQRTVSECDTWLFTTFMKEKRFFPSLYFKTISIFYGCIKYSPKRMKSSEVRHRSIIQLWLHSGLNYSMKNKSGNVFVENLKQH